MGNENPHAENLTTEAKAPPAIIFRFDGGSKISPPVATHFVPSEATQHVFFGDQVGTPREIWWQGAQPKTLENLSTRAGAPHADLSSPFRSLVAADGSQHLVILAGEVFMDLVARH
jgi:hypothetical protein